MNFLLRTIVLSVLALAQAVTAAPQELIDEITRTTLTLSLQHHFINDSLSYQNTTASIAVNLGH
ncbi:MAG: hypothetical protein HY940_07525 [Gammaproteobacteria bacterium]|nr:hypothetical protein [Gammaproteobacteria bacterium]